MAENKVKFRLKGHESFQIREGWLRKGIKAIQSDAGVFTRDNAADVLGVGVNMVKAIRFWLQASGLSYEKIVHGGKREQFLTKNFGEVINEYDPYFEDIFSLWLIHYKIASNSELSTSWYLFFNENNFHEFTKDEMNYHLNVSLKRFTKNEEFSSKTLADDCDCIIKTYLEDARIDKTPEDNILCPLTELGLLEKSSDFDSLTYVKKAADVSKLDELLVLYIILDNLKEDRSTSIDKILNDRCNAGKVLNLDRSLLNEYLDILKNSGYLDVNRTAGLDKVYVSKEITKEDVLKHYYNKL